MASPMVAQRSSRINCKYDCNAGDAFAVNNNNNNDDIIIMIESSNKGD
jgi:hypothetical protein